MYFPKFWWILGCCLLNKLIIEALHSSKNKNKTPSPIFANNLQEEGKELLTPVFQVERKKLGSRIKCSSYPLVGGEWILALASHSLRDREEQEVLLSLMRGLVGVRGGQSLNFPIYL